MHAMRATSGVCHYDEPKSYVADVPISQQRWSLDSIDWSTIQSDTVNEPDAFFYMIAAASFLESATDHYTANLIAQFRGDSEITTWLEQHWLPEELHHGRALRRYVQIAWPNFDWDRAYEAFLDEFSCYCCADELEPTRTREMASRCVVEMGTASYYTTLSRTNHDPALAIIARRIAEDEVSHYKRFYTYFRRYQQIAPESRSAVLRALVNRLRMIDRQDGVLAMKHLYVGVHPGKSFDRSTYRALRSSSRSLIRPHFPHRMCVQMLLKPLDLSPRTSRIAVPLMEALARWVVP